MSKLEPTFIAVYVKASDETQIGVAREMLGACKIVADRNGLDIRVEIPGLVDHLPARTVQPRTAIGDLH